MVERDLVGFGAQPDDHVKVALPEAAAVRVAQRDDAVKLGADARLLRHLARDI